MHSVAPRASLPLRLYRFAVEHGARWPLGGTARPAPAAGPPRVGYHLWRFPSLTGTYIHREVGALRQAGLDVEVFADIAERDASARRRGARLRRRARTICCRSTRSGCARIDGACCGATRWLRCNAFAYTALHRYGAAQESAPRTCASFATRSTSPVTLLEHGITHLHSPWANLSAFVALLAARMAGVPYSVQARASTDLYRNRARWGLAERFAHAKFIVTNSEFNRAFIERDRARSEHRCRSTSSTRGSTRRASCAAPTRASARRPAPNSRRRATERGEGLRASSARAGAAARARPRLPLRHRRRRRRMGQPDGYDRSIGGPAAELEAGGWRSLCRRVAVRSRPARNTRGPMCLPCPPSSPATAGAT